MGAKNVLRKRNTRQLYTRLGRLSIGVCPYVVFSHTLEILGRLPYNRVIPQQGATVKTETERLCHMATAKIANYTAEQTAQIVDAYNAGNTVEMIAEMVGKSTRSIVAKLSREGVYKKKEYVTKNGEKAVKKDAHADAIGAILKLPENDIESLTKANKSALKAIFDALANSRPIDG